MALVGENGAGKTTLLKLLLRFYDVSEGRVLVGGLDLRELDLREWRRRVGAVFQDFGRYAYTVRENITLAGLEHARDLERFAEMARGRTTLLITHRLASVRMADRILVLKQGRLIEEGSHEQLLALGSEYAEPAEPARPAAGF